MISWESIKLKTFLPSEQVGPLHPGAQVQLSGAVHSPPFSHSGRQTAGNINGVLITKLGT